MQLVELLATLAEWQWKLPEWDISELTNSWLALAVGAVVLVIFIWWIARLSTHAAEDIDRAELDRQMLTAVSDLRSQGELTQEEYRSIKGRLVERLASDDSSKAKSSTTPTKDKGIEATDNMPELDAENDTSEQDLDD